MEAIGRIKRAGGPASFVHGMMVAYYAAAWAAATLAALVLLLFSVVSYIVLDDVGTECVIISATSFALWVIGTVYFVHKVNQLD